MVSNRLVKLAVIAMALPVASWAETFYIKLDATDFSQPGSYTNSAGVALTTLPHILPVNHPASESFCGYGCRLWD